MKKLLQSVAFLKKYFQFRTCIRLWPEGAVALTLDGHED